MSYPAWIDGYARSSHQLMSGVVPGRWSSLNGWATFAAYQGAFLSRIHELMKAHEKAGTPRKELSDLFSNPSSLRWAFYALLKEYFYIQDKVAHRESAREVFEWLNALLESGMREDAWAVKKNIVHDESAVRSILDSGSWIEGDIQAVRNAGKLYTSSAAMAFALYRDFFPQDAHEVFGPYDASSRFGEGASLIVKYFPKIRPVELWPEVSEFPYEEIKIYQILTKDVHFNCEFIGMHSLYDAPVVPNTLAVAVEAGGRFLNADEIQPAADIVARYATDYSHLYEKLDIPAAKKKFVEWEAYQFVNLFKAVGMDWRPTDAMLAPVMAADIEMGFILDSFPPLEEYVSSSDYEIYWLKELFG